MASGRKIELEEWQRVMLVEMREHHPKPYMRERAAAILKVADGQSISAVARQGLLRWRERETITAWLDRFEEQGLVGLYIRAGRGRKGAFSPNRPD